MSQAGERILRPFAFWNRLERYSMLPADLSVLQKQGNLEDDLVAVMMSGYEHTFDGVDLSAAHDAFPGGEKAFMETIMSGVEKKYRTQARELVPTMCNLVAVMACTIFDTYLCDSLEVLLLRESKVVKALAREKDVSAFDVIDLEPSQSAVAIIAGKIMHCFDHEGIEGKLRMLERGGVDLDQVFGPAYVLEEVREEHAKSKDHLIMLYNRRNGIVHQHELVYKAPDEVVKFDVLLHRLMLCFALVISKKWSIPVDFFLIATNPADPRLRQEWYGTH